MVLSSNKVLSFGFEEETPSPPSYILYVSKGEVRKTERKIGLVSQVVEVQRVLQWLFVSQMTPRLVNHPLAPDWSSGVPSSTAALPCRVPASRRPVPTAAKRTACPLGRSGRATPFNTRWSSLYQQDQRLM